jgi:glycosyltransferase involved in cell wall biosynthesis
VKLVAIVLTWNEAKHILRCLHSLRGVADEVLVVDSFSTDETLGIAQCLGARVLQHPFLNQAQQFNWALTQLGPDISWVLRIDADEYLTPELATEICERLPALGPEVEGVVVARRIAFQGRMIRHGGVFPVRVLRLFRAGCGACENRWMDEHIKVGGVTVAFRGELIDENLNSLTWWTEKHNRYASREVVDLLNLKYGFMPSDSVARLRGGSRAGLKRWVKERIYAGLPMGFRAFAYFFYRYVVRLGFLDGRDSASFHVLQAFWYRYLVDAKLAEVTRYMRAHDADVRDAIENVLGIRI